MHLSSRSDRSIFPLSIQSNSKLVDDFCDLVSFAHKACERIDKAAKGDTSRNEVWFKMAFECYVNETHSLPYYG